MVQSAVVLSRYVSFMHKVHGYIANSLWTLSGIVTVCLIASDMFCEIWPTTNILERCRWSRFRDPDITLPFYSLGILRAAKTVFAEMQHGLGVKNGHDALSDGERTRGTRVSNIGFLRNENSRTIFQRVHRFKIYR